MSPVTGFDDAYAQSRGRLLLQLYAYSADADAAEDALNEAFISASHHWHRVRRQENLDSWLRELAIKRIDRRPRPARDRALAAISRSGAASYAGRASAEHLRLLAALQALDPVSRRLTIVRRLEGSDLPSAAREVGLTDAAAEQALARATTTLHSAGVDATPASLRRHLDALSVDLAGRPAASARALRRAGGRRRYAGAALVGVLVVAVISTAGYVSAARPFATLPATPHPTTPTTPSVTIPAPHLGAGDLLTISEIIAQDPHGGWQVASPRTPAGSSVYGDCVMAADNPPPRTRWIAEFAPGDRPASPTDQPLRQVLQLAPSTAEAQRSFRQVVVGFTGCAGRQLLTYQSVGGLGNRARLVSLRFSATGGTVHETVLIVQSGPAVAVLLAQSAAGGPTRLGPQQLTGLASTAVNRICTNVHGRCAAPPYPISPLRPPGDGTAGGFLSVVDLPLVAGTTAAWAGTTPQTSDQDPSATPCQRAGFTTSGASAVSSRSFVMPDATALPARFGLSETIGTFATVAAAKSFVAKVTTDIRSCPARQATLTLQGSATFTTHLSSGLVWRLRQMVSPKRTVLFRMALIRDGATVAQVTLTPVGKYDVSQADFVSLGKRAGVRLAG